MVMTTYGVLSPPVGDRDHAWGRQDAPVTVVLYGDFECPYSGKAFRAVKRLQGSLPDGFRYVYRHFPIARKHRHAQQAAEASEAAAAQGRFWEYHDLLYHHQNELGERDLVRYAADLRLDVGSFEQDLAEHAHAAKVREDSEGGEASGVNGTPTFFVNGDIFEGFYEYAELFDVITKEIP